MAATNIAIRGQRSLLKQIREALAMDSLEQAALSAELAFQSTLGRVLKSGSGSGMTYALHPKMRHTFIRQNA